jgi:chromosome partitioning protein
MTLLTTANQAKKPGCNILSIVNQKGGVGKTTTAVNLSAGLAKLGHKVLLVDFDPQGNASSYLGINITQLLKSSLDFMQGSSLSDCRIVQVRDNLDILPSNIKLGSYNQGTNSNTNTNALLTALKRGAVDKEYDFVIIDCQPSLSTLTINAMVASTGLIITMQAEYLALDGLSQLLLTLKQVKQKLNTDLNILGVLITMYDKRNKLCQEVKQELVNNMPNELFETSIARLVKLAESPSHGKTIYEYEPNGQASHSYLDFSKEVVKRVNKE